MHLHHGIWHLNPNKGERRGKRSSWSGREKKSWYPSITDGLGNARYPSLGEEIWPTSQAAMPNDSRGPGGNKTSSIFSEWLTRTFASVAHQTQVGARWGEYQAGRISERIRGCAGLHEDAELYCQCYMITVHLPGLYGRHSWSTLAEEPQHHPTLSSITGISLLLPVFSEMRLYLDKMGDFSYYQVDPPA